MSTFLYLGSSQIINDNPPPQKNKNKNHLFIKTKRGIMKVKIYKGFTYVHCLFVVAVIGDEER
jgi:hypothetical protein